VEIEHQFIVENECEGWRLDHFLHKKNCRVAGRSAKPSQRVSPGQTVTFRRPAPEEPMAPRELPILHEDPAFYALDKPAGIAMHPTAKFHFSTVTSVLRERFVGEPLQITHRLDLETSGVLLVARGREAAVRLKSAFAARCMRKRYLALVHGYLQGEGTIDLPLGAHGGLVRVKMGVRMDGLPARTHYRAVSHHGSYSLIECRPETGRQHQIRAHLCAIGHPVVGDKLYPDERIFADYQDRGWDAVADRLISSRQALHASELSFDHPFTGEPVVVRSEWPRDLEFLCL
jgi:23S rRNA pseudouridine1911/1915/1917 synthase